MPTVVAVPDLELISSSLPPAAGCLRLLHRTPPSHIAGGPVLFAGDLAVMFGGIDQHGGLAGLSALLVAVFGFSLGVWLLVRGFNLDAVAALDAPTVPGPGVAAEPADAR
jgi:hypothetical protein